MGKEKDYKELLTTPLETNIKDFQRIANYFLYYAPCINSAQSAGKINDNDAKSIFEELITQAGLEKKNKIVKKVKSGVWKSNNLDEDMLDFEVARFTCDQYNNETELQAMLRHIRNALAHGYIYVWRKRNGNYVFFQDFDRKKGKITAKLMLSMKILEDWKGILEKYTLNGQR